MPLLIKNGLVYDGTGSVPQKNDILVQGDRIIKIDEALKSSRGEVIDAKENLVLPGFVDIHTHVDENFQIFSHPQFEHFIEEGVTTVVGGNSGRSIAPFFNKREESIWKQEENVNWTSVKEFFSTLSKRKVGINFGTLVGYTSVRQFVTRNTSRDITDEEFVFIKKVLEKSFKEGLLGVSLDIGNLETQLIPFKEIKKVADIVKKHDGVLVITLRNKKDEIVESVKEIIKIAKKSGVRIEINSFYPTNGFEKQYTEALSLLERKGVEGINFDLPPFPVSVVPIQFFLPPWLRGEEIGDVKKMIKTTGVQERVLPSWRYIHGEKIIIGNLPLNLEFLEGKNLKEFSDSLNTTQSRGLLRLMDLSDMKAICFVENENEKVFKELLLSECSIIASHSANFVQSEALHRRYRKRFSELLQGTFEGPHAFETLVAKLSGIPAEKYGIKKRGLIKEGYYADIVILKDFAPREVLVNGERVLKKAKTLSGHIIRKNHIS